MTFREFLTYVPFVRIFVRPLKSPGPVPSEGAKGESNAPASPAYKRDMRLTIAMDALSLLLMYILISPMVAMPIYSRLVFHPISENDDLSGEIKTMENYFHCHFRNITFKAIDGESMHGWYFERPGANKIILVSHGNAGCMEHRLPLLPLLLQTGCSVFMYDYEGFGSSTGSPSMAKICDDATAAFDYITQKLDVKPENVIVYGESIGGGATSTLSTKRKVGAIILQSTFTSFPEAAADKLVLMRLYPAFVFPEPTLNNLAIMKKEHAPLLLIHGMKDDLLPYRYSQRIMTEAVEPKTLVLLPNAGHNDVYVIDVNVTIPALNKFIHNLN
ncbi:MAG: alpha/beta hydrolase [Candidatus Obscuribacterales bacterium]|nr:alpha/beta hydrolase [Candidatus Obscuribacterales bacterium]